MSRVCQVTGKRPMSGNNVSHSHRKTRRHDYRRTEGVLRAWETISVDLATGDTIGVTTLKAVRTGA